MERLTKMLEDKQVELIKRVKEADRLSQRESDLQARLQKVNDLLLQWDWELEVECQRVERATHEKEERERTL